MPQWKLTRLSWWQGCSMIIAIMRESVRGAQLWRVFLFCFIGGGGGGYETREYPNTTMSHLDGDSYACRWWHNIDCWPYSFVVFRRSGPVWTLYFCDISGRGWSPDPFPPPLWICTWLCQSPLVGSGTHMLIKLKINALFHIPIE